MYVPKQPTNLTVKVKVNHDDNDVQESVETVLVCAKGNCGKPVEIRFDSVKTVQNVLCPEHGFLISFPDRKAFMDFSGWITNKILEANGHSMISDETKVALVDDKADPKSLN